MAAWNAKVEQILRQPAGLDDGFSAEDIAREANTDFSKLSTWEIVCEEVLDTTFPRIHYQRAREELLRRGIAETEIEELRRVAWQTAGWLNFEKQLWDWTSLDEKDLTRAIEWQYRERWITTERRRQLLTFVIQHTCR